MRTIFARILFHLLLIVPLTAATAADATPPVRVDLETTLGAIELELDRERAPKTVENFLRYVDEGFYQGTIFHRVIAGFMIQGGGFTSEFERKTTHSAVPNEADNGLRNERGTIAMARTSDPHSATAQFFVNVADNDFLDHRSKDARGWGYTVIGRVTRGMEIVDKIAALPTGSGGPFGKDVPAEAVVITAAAQP